MHSTDSYSTLVISGHDVEQIVQRKGIDQIMDEIIQAIEIAILQYDLEKTIIPIRSGFNYQTPVTGLVEWMPLYQKEEEVTLKVVGYHPDNPALHNLPTILSSISLYDTTNGRLVGLVDGVFLTALRTGAATAIASKNLAKDDSKILGIIGCGAQSVTQLHALSREFDLERILIHDVDQESENSFGERVSILDLDLEIEITDIDTIIGESDIVCTCTSIGVGEGPLFSNITPKEHLHINAVGSDFPGKVELPLELLNRSFVCPDFKMQATIEGECQQLEAENIGAELAEVVQNKANYDHFKQKQTVFDSTGWALEDHVIMKVFLRYAKEFGLGQHIQIEAISNNVKNPYEFLNELKVKDRKEVFS